jgi:hypothetical protein
MVTRAIDRRWGACVRACGVVPAVGGWARAGQDLKYVLSPCPDRLRSVEVAQSAEQLGGWTD